MYRLNNENNRWDKEIIIAIVMLLLSLLNMVFMLCKQEWLYATTNFVLCLTWLTIIKDHTDDY